MRHVLADLRGDNQHPGYRRLWRFLSNTRHYYADTPAAYQARQAQDLDRWSGVDYGRAAVASHVPAVGNRVLHITRGSPQQAAAAVLSHLERSSAGQPA